LILSRLFVNFNIIWKFFRFFMKTQWKLILMSVIVKKSEIFSK
jgi:hypothetical protein